MIRYRSRQSLISFFLLILFSVFSVITLFPIFALIMSSFRPGTDLMRFGITMESLLNRDKNLDNYRELFFGERSLFNLWFRNSMIILMLQTSVTVFLTSLVGYGLAVYTFKGRNVLIGLVLILMMVPIQILILPLYKMMITMKLMNTILGVMLPFMLSPIAIFFFRQFCLGLPLELMDAARIDGLSESGIYFRIMSHLMLPAYGAMAILEGLRSWNNYLWPLIVLRTTKKFTIPIGLNTLLTPYGNNYNVLISGAVIATIPIIILFLMFQRYFISGLSSGSVKG
ncbi:carbohydrate ABC transporter permease [Oceanispirochaeta sp.]|jgi:arabinosaccharide transport system permease protein|uniref:carbohydrate ABC transporter permease n=1 Tax=Oceanispirochaeta sp. TaxID=2035350 RepID=UPI00260931F0|nr:carbohydrate ABC transporter permease [Oceanispirochaeta sp.]MDA3955283.1 carbohydrate ABC transporter permease [Oceanispirochaeta sp.]